MPRIDEATVILLSCTASKEELGDLITSELSSWTQCINDKSSLLTSLFHEQPEGTDFLTYLNDIRAEYDVLKDDELVFIVKPDLEIPDILDACPEDVQD